ncbi:serine acetyltransferase [bacterium]|nr:serine acetyltransferase [bacterium]
MIIKDLVYKAECFYGKCSLKEFLKILFSDGTSCMVFYRMSKFFHCIKLEVVSWIILEINKLVNGCVIGRGVDFKKGFVVMHGIGVVINSNVKGGENIVLESGVVIGAARSGMPIEVPLLGSNIFIGSGAKILGGIKIGNNVKIGANAVVVKDVPDNVTVVGIPARIVK